MVKRIDGGEMQITALKHRIERAQRRVRGYVRNGRSLADELIAERRADAKQSLASQKQRPSLPNNS